VISAQIQSAFALAVRAVAIVFKIPGVGRVILIRYVVHASQYAPANKIQGLIAQFHKMGSLLSLCLAWF